MPTRAGCGLCNWQEDFREYGEAKEAVAFHDCSSEDDQLPVWVKDISWEESELERDIDV